MCIIQTLTPDHISSIERQLNEAGYDNVEFSTIDEDPDKSDICLVWFRQDRPKAPYQYVIAELDFRASRPPFLNIKYCQGD